MSLRYTLDPRSDNPPAPGSVVVSDEVTLLREFLGSEWLWVRGERLCQWAEGVAQAREQMVDWLGSPADELVKSCPDLSSDQATQLLAELGSRLVGVRRPLEPVEIAQRLWPDLGLFEVEPDPEHAFRWLLWLVERNLGAHDLAFARAVSLRWAVQTVAPLSMFYKASDPHQAWEYIKLWLRLLPTTPEWLSPAPPTVALPEWALRKLQKEWRLEVVQTKGQFYRELVGLAPEKGLLKAAAQVTAEVFATTPKYLSLDHMEALRSWIGVSERDALLGLLPPRRPQPPPRDFEKMGAWFIQEYLPFRLWRGGGSSEQLARVGELARDFASWFLPYYAASRAGGAGVEHLSWTKTSRLSEAADAVTLLMVLDGLGYPDAERFVKGIHDRSHRLSLDDFTLALAPLPTVTEFAKPALLAGVHPTAALGEVRVGALEKRDPDVVGALNAASPGAIVIWSLLDPDVTYHRRLDSETMRSEVDARLNSLADRLVRIAHATQDSVRLRVVVSTDHGRLLTNATRCQPPPIGMTAHGRAAWGPASIRFGSDGFIVDGDIVYLHPERFGVPEVCAILLSDAAYLTSDGRGGEESYPHGGIYPEEVLIPWIQLSRDRGPLVLAARLTGHGIAGSQGTLHLEIANGSEVRLHVQELKLGRIGQRVPLDLEVAALSAEITPIDVSGWPTPAECGGFDAVLSYKLPTGELRTFCPECSVTSDELYRQDDILGDL